MFGYILLFTLFAYSLFSETCPKVQEPTTPKCSPSLVFFREPLEESRGVLGNWQGARDLLAERGIFVHGGYAINVASNLGGKSQGIEQTSSIEADITIDCDSLLSIPYAELFISSAFRFGKSLAETKIGNVYSVQQEFGGQTFRLIDLYFAFRIPEKIYCKLGRINTGEDFQVSRFFSTFMNNTFNGNPITPNFNFLFSVFPVSTWGAYVEVHPTKNARIKTGAYNNNKRIFDDDTHGVYFSFAPSLGALLYTEVSWHLEHFSQFSGIYTIGGAYSTGKTNRALGKDIRGNYELYLQIEESFSFGEGSSLSPFSTFLYFPEDRNEFPYFFLLGAVIEGIIPTREKDSISVGFSYGAFSQKLSTKQSFEGAFELNYKAHLSSFFYVQPNIQYIIRPAGTGDIPDAFVFGLQSECLF